MEPSHATPTSPTHTPWTTCPHDGTTSHNPELPKSGDHAALCADNVVTVCCGAYATIDTDSGELVCRCCYYAV